MKKLVLLVCSLFFFNFSYTKVIRIEIESRTPILNGKTFGPFGAYELIRGKIYFGIHPENKYNQAITDIKLAPRNKDGLVEAWGDLIVLQAVDPAKRSGTALVEVSNRGGKFSPSYFNRASKSRELVPDDPDYWGNELLMREGFTVIWIGWQFDIPEGKHNLKLHVPQALNSDGSSITGWVRSDWTVDRNAAFLGIGHRNLRPYPAIELKSGEHRLTVRDGRDAARFTIPRDQWQFAQILHERMVPSNQHIYLEGGFQAGKIYELVYKAKDPAIVGLGLVAIRDVISYAKYDKDCPFSVKDGLAAGVSQTGRFLRHFLYQGFNTDEQGRKAYDGMMIITAGAGRGSFNHRFAQPSRDAHRYSAFFYPTDLFPFTGKEQTDIITEKTDGLLSHLHKENHAPKIFYINSGYEYWGRSASLIHTDLEGQKDVEPLENERIYHLSSGQHFVDRFPPNRQMKGTTIELYRGNPLEIKVNYRALLLQLRNWVAKNQAPPESKYPRIDENNLVRKEKLNFPKIPGLDLPSTIHHPYRANYGSRWPQGVVDRQPPHLEDQFPTMISQVDKVGNEKGGVLNVEIRVPLATYTPWNLRKGFVGGSHELTDFRGTYVPFSKDKTERIEKEDPRPSIISLYPTKADFLAKVKTEAKKISKEGFLLAEDIEYVSDRAEQHWDWIFSKNDPYEGLTKGPEKGTLMIIGGGRLDDLFYQKFMEFAGDANAPIVVIPTAAGDGFFEDPKNSERLQKRFEAKGFKNVSILHTRDPKVANTPEFTKAIEEANGVWFMGGRQWRLADSYLNNRTHQALNDLLSRGGVIAGSSAGATIQGSYLARGDTKTNTIMMGDHEEGLGFVSNIAIDQHVLARNREFDLFEILDHKPELLGIGLDENTGIIVQGNQFEVIGKSYVAIYDGKRWSQERRAYYPLPKGSRKFYFLRSGHRYDLNKRRIIE